MAGTKDIVIPSYTDRELTVKGDAELLPQNIRNGVNLFGVLGTMSEGMKADFGTVTFSEASGSAVTSFTIHHNLGAVPNNFYLFPSGRIYPPEGQIEYDRANWGAVAVFNDQCYGLSTYDSYGGETIVYESAITLNKTQNSVTVQIPYEERIHKAFYTGAFAWLVN